MFQVRCTDHIELYPNLGETAFSIWPVRRMTVPANKGPVGWDTKPIEEKQTKKIK